MNDLEQIISQEIKEQGPITFYRFQEYCLYHPLHGYYNSSRHKIGKQGDFYTSPSVHPVFGETIARFLLQKWEEIGKPSVYTVVEYGAGTGNMAHAILSEVARCDSPIRTVFRYCIIERSPRLRSIQQEKLQGYPVSWIHSPSEIAPFDGCVVSNELIDAFPVHLVEKTKNGLQELYVDVDGNRFFEKRGDLSKPEIEEYISAYVPHLINGQKIEINLDALAWLAEVGQSMRCGHVVTIDYGYTAEMLYHPSRIKGTLRGFRQHRLIENPFESPGETDLTHDVNFTALMNYGESIGLETTFFGSQAEFLIQAGILERLSVNEGNDPFRDEVLKRNMAIKHLILPGVMGTAFQVLVQQRINV
ncbi:SAM-dependent methyltransferase [Collibacillus ludicampi]|uniref:SAM-dependent methyltransferase n=1 Tax=Collibacillus ludicampi TaxID=2771369 RepID=A0AAV4LMM0_9BACL|nr:SAM-dependent methyltransferase [Collibacillus ludicampi]GIM48327.1 SAM-dependent methyltransferase [Collibacillus ludicampi]